MENRGRVWEILEVTLAALTDELNMEVGRKKQIKEKFSILSFGNYVDAVPFVRWHNSGKIREENMAKMLMLACP